MIPQEILDIKDMLDSILGTPRREIDDSLQLEYPCPRCIDKYGKNEEYKYNLSISLRKMRFQCWKCASEGDDDMRGSVSKLFKLYGGDEYVSKYHSKIKSLKESELYRLKFNSINDGEKLELDDDTISLPNGYKPFIEGYKFSSKAMEYLANRGIGWDIINKYNIGYTTYIEGDMKNSYRIVIPSYDPYMELNYWVGRDYMCNNSKKMKYNNPKVEKKDIIFNERFVQWDADVTIVEGAFDHIVVPNSIPLLGKALNDNFKVYWDIINKANANVNIMLDGDAFDTAKKVYSTLNHGRLYGKIKYIPMGENEDPSLVYQEEGWKGIAKKLSQACKIKEAYLAF